MSIAFGVVGQGSAVGGKKAAPASTDDSMTAQIQGLQKQLGDLEKQLKDLQDSTAGAPTPAQLQMEQMLAKQIAAIEAEIKQLQQAAVQQKAQQDAKNNQVSQTAKASQNQAFQNAGIDYKPELDYKAELGFRGVDGVVTVAPQAGAAQAAAPASAPSSVGDTTALVGSVIDTQA
jgi:chromosome segregation ATPase